MDTTQPACDLVRPQSIAHPSISRKPSNLAVTEVVLIIAYPTNTEFPIRSPIPVQQPPLSLLSSGGRADVDWVAETMTFIGVLRKYVYNKNIFLMM